MVQRDLIFKKDCKDIELTGGYDVFKWLILCFFLIKSSWLDPYSTPKKIVKKRIVKQMELIVE